jgi:hypothetical protein
MWSVNNSIMLFFIVFLKRSQDQLLNRCVLLLRFYFEALGEVIGQVKGVA